MSALAVQLWMQGWMAHHGWGMQMSAAHACFPNAFPSPAEPEETVQQSTHVAREIQQVAMRSLASIGLITEDLGMRLADVRRPLDLFIEWAVATSDDVWQACPTELEQCGAAALLGIDAVLTSSRLQASLLTDAEIDLVISLQHDMQDIVVLLCSRGINPAQFHKQRMPLELLTRLQAVFAVDVLRHDHLLSRLGNSIYHLFRAGKGCKGCKPRKRGGKKGGNHDLRRATQKTAHLQPSGCFEVTSWAAITRTIPDVVAAPSFGDFPRITDPLEEAACLWTPDDTLIVFPLSY